MKETEVLRRINDVDSELIDEAEFFLKRKRNVWKAFFPVAVSFLLLVGCM